MVDSPEWEKARQTALFRFTALLLASSVAIVNCSFLCVAGTVEWRGENGRSN